MFATTTGAGTYGSPHDSANNCADRCAEFGANGVAMKKLLVLVPFLFCIGCSNLTAKNDNASATGMPWDSVVAVGQGPGCVVPDPYVTPPAPTPAPVVLTPHSLCDPGGGNCRSVMMTERVAADPSTVCNISFAQSKGPGATAWIGGLGAIVISILTLAGGGI